MVCTPKQNKRAAGKPSASSVSTESGDNQGYKD